jgi:hypothetical protein
VPAFETEAFDVGCAGFADSETVETEKHSERRVGSVIAFRSEEEHPELGAVHASGGRGRDLGAPDVLGRVRHDAAVDVREPVEPADRRETSVDSGGGQAAFFEPAAVGLDVWPSRTKDVEVDIVGPLEEVAEVMAVRIKGAAAVTGKERSSSDVCLVGKLGREPGNRSGHGHGHGHGVLL